MPESNYLLVLLLIFVNFARCAEFNPYVDNKGTIVSIAGKNFCIIASDTRLSDQYMIRSRNISRIFQISDTAVFGGTMCWSDCVELSLVLKQAAHEFEWSSERPLTVSEASYLLSNTLYYRRFFPYYVFSVLAGLDSDGIGAVYRYDAVGSFERVRAACVANAPDWLFIEISLKFVTLPTQILPTATGEGERLIQPLLDELSNMDADDALWEDFGPPFVAPANALELHALRNSDDCSHREGLEILLVKAHNDANSTKSSNFTSADMLTSSLRATTISAISSSHRPISTCYHVDIELEDACDTIMNGFRAAAERDVSVGDGVTLWILRSRKSDLSEQIEPSVRDHEESKRAVISTINADKDKVAQIRKAILNEALLKYRNSRPRIEKRWYPLPRH